MSDLHKNYWNQKPGQLTEEDIREANIFGAQIARSSVDHPVHYTQGGIEAIDVIEAWELGFSLGNAVKYISRAGKKDPTKTLEDLEKAAWYVQREIERLKGKV